MFITAAPITKLFAWGEEGIVEDMCYESATTSPNLCGLVCPSRISKHGGKEISIFVSAVHLQEQLKGIIIEIKGGGEEGEHERERALGLLCPCPGHSG